MSRQPESRQHGSRQHGAVMIVGLIILVVLGVMGTTTLGDVNMLERMVSNMHDSNRAEQGAEAALSFCEGFLDGLDVAYQDELYSDEIHADDDDDTVIQEWWDSGSKYSDWWADWGFFQGFGIEATALGFADEGRPGRLAQQPHCFRQRISAKSHVKTDKVAFTDKYGNVDNVMADRSGDALKSGGIYQFRVTGMSFGTAKRADGQGRSKTVLQSDYFKRLN